MVNVTKKQKNPVIIIIFSFIRQKYNFLNSQFNTRIC